MQSYRCTGTAKFERRRKTEVLFGLQFHANRISRSGALRKGACYQFDVPYSSQELRYFPIS